MRRSDKIIAACLLAVAAVCVAVLASMPVLPGEPGYRPPTPRCFSEPVAGGREIIYSPTGRDSVRGARPVRCPGK